MTDQLIKTLALSNRGQVSWGSSSCLMARLTPSALWGGHLHAPLLYHCVGTTSTSSELSKQTTENIAGLLHENKNHTLLTSLTLLPCLPNLHKFNNKNDSKITEHIDKSINACFTECVCVCVCARNSLSRMMFCCRAQI